jgi:discoidin domain receptor family protein 2
MIPISDKTMLNLMQSNYLPPLLLQLVLLLLLLVNGEEAGDSASFPASCNESLPVRALSASSAYQEAVGAHHGRLDNEAGGGAWCPMGVVSSAAASQPEFLQLDLGSQHEDDTTTEEEFVVRGVVLQGRWANGLGQEFAEQVMIQYWRPGLSAFRPYVTAQGSAVMEANRDTHSKVLISLKAEADGGQSQGIVASKLRIIPVSSHPRTVCLRVGLLGCSGRGETLFILIIYNAFNIQFLKTNSLIPNFYYQNCML